MYNITKLNQTLGYYRPAFFKLYIRSLNPINLRALTPNEMTTFIHEYTHFIQDFTTIKGVQNIFNTFEWLSLYINATYRTRKLEIPINVNHPILDLNTHISNSTWGSGFVLNQINTLSNISIGNVNLPQEILTKHPELSTLRVVSAIANLSNGVTKPLEIGTLGVMESMAHIAESLMGLRQTTSPDYPYNIVRLMANTLCASLNLSDDVLFAVCDIALQCSIPGAAVVEMLQGFANGNNPVPRSGYDVYNTFNQAFSEWHNQNANCIVNLAKNHLLELVHPPMGLHYQAWVNNIINMAVIWRTSNPAFLLDMFNQHNLYAPIINNVGTPLMVNAVDEYSKVPYTSYGNSPITMDVEFFTAVDYIMNLFEYGDRRCPMQEWCRESGVLVDTNCTIDPPIRANITQYAELCPVGALWRSWNLRRYHLNKQHIFRPICRK